jgi:DNA-binding GntR family transcriptional regulator
MLRDRNSGRPPASWPQGEGLGELTPIALLRTKSLATVIQHELERMIVEGEFAPNERINENALAQRFGVSRGPIREACSALAGLGLMQSVPNRGFFVRELSDAEAAEVCEARAGLFACMTMLAAEKRSATDVDTLRQLVDRMEEIAGTDEVSAYYAVNLAFHAEIARLSQNARLAQLYLSLARELHIQRYRALAGGHVLSVSNAEHRAIFEAVAAGDGKRAFGAGRTHIVNGTARSHRAATRLQR